MELATCPMFLMGDAVIMGLMKTTPTFHTELGCTRLLRWRLPMTAAIAHLIAHILHAIPVVAPVVIAVTIVAPVTAVVTVAVAPVVVVVVINDRKEKHENLYPRFAGWLQVK